MRKHVITLMVLVAVAANPLQKAEAGAFATEITQLLNQAQLVLAYIRQGLQLENEVSMLANMVRFYSSGLGAAKAWPRSPESAHWPGEAVQQRAPDQPRALVVVRVRARQRRSRVSAPPDRVEEARYRRLPVHRRVLLRMAGECAYSRTRRQITQAAEARSIHRRPPRRYEGIRRERKACRAERRRRMCLHRFR